jgi:hypothetical protein
MEIGNWREKLNESTATHKIFLPDASNGIEFILYNATHGFALRIEFILYKSP